VDPKRSLAWVPDSGSVGLQNVILVVSDCEPYRVTRNAVDISAWLRELVLGRYEQAFRDNEVDVRSLPHLTADDLRDMV
jgi:hypothetical protein